MSHNQCHTPLSFYSIAKRQSLSLTIEFPPISSFKKSIAYPDSQQPEQSTMQRGMKTPMGDLARFVVVLPSYSSVFSLLHRVSQYKGPSFSKLLLPENQGDDKETCLVLFPTCSISQF